MNATGSPSNRGSRTGSSLWSGGCPTYFRCTALSASGRLLRYLLTTIAFLMYASPAWWGYSSANDRARIDQLLRKLKRFGFLPKAAPDAETLAREADDRLLKSILFDPNHVLRKHFPEARPTNYNLRPRAHEFKLPLKDDRNFVPRLLFKDMY